MQESTKRNPMICPPEEIPLAGSVKAKLESIGFHASAQMTSDGLIRWLSEEWGVYCVVSKIGIGEYSYTYHTKISIQHFNGEVKIPEYQGPLHKSMRTPFRRVYEVVLLVAVEVLKYVKDGEYEHVFRMMKD